MNSKLFKVIKSSLKRSLNNRAGSPTVEYVVLMVCGVLLVSILYAALNSNSVETSLQEKIKEVISGQEQVSTVVTNSKNNISPPPNPPLSEDPLLPKNDPSQTHSLQSSSEPITEKGFWNQFKNGWNSFTKTTWNKTKHITSQLWEGSKQIASNVWNWTKENKEYVAGGSVFAIGTSLLFVSPPVGAGILISSAIGGVISWLTGSDSKTIANDTAIGGLAGLISMGVGGAVTSVFKYGFKGLLSKLTPFAQKYLPLAFGGGAAGATDSAIWDKLKNGAISWKKALLSAAFGLGFVFGVGHLVEKAPAIVSKFNQLPVTPVTVFSDGSISAPKTIGDTGFGQFLNKFVSKESGATPNPKNNFSKKDGANVTPSITYLKASKKYYKIQGEYTSSYSASQVLREELYKAGIKPPPYPNAAHHIVPWNMRGEASRKARDILDKYGIDYDSAANGVFLPYKNNTYVGDEILHVGSHSQKYAEYVKNRLVEVENKFKTRETILNELNQIRAGLLKGSIKLN